MMVWKRTLPLPGSRYASARPAPRSVTMIVTVQIRLYLEAPFRTGPRLAQVGGREGPAPSA